MKAIKRPDQSLRLRDVIWHYVRRVPKAVSHVDERTLIYPSLDTNKRKVRDSEETYTLMQMTNDGTRSR